MALSPPVAGPASRHPRHAPGQSNASRLADALENPRDDFDRLIGDLRLATRFGAPEYDRIEERAQMIANAIVAPFRGVRDPSAPPLAQQQAGGKCSAWF